MAKEEPSAPTRRGASPLPEEFPPPGRAREFSAPDPRGEYSPPSPEQEFSPPGSGGRNDEDPARRKRRLRRALGIARRMAKEKTVSRFVVEVIEQTVKEYVAVSAQVLRDRLPHFHREKGAQSGE